MDNFRLAVLVPCFNEGDSIFQVVESFKTHLPEADIYVYDNNSTDQTGAQAHKAGAIVRSESRQGKGRVVCRMFSDIEADVYVLVDGDGTYDASAAKRMILTLLDGQFDVINGKRIESHEKNYRPGHRIGNFLLTGLVARIFSRQFSDMLSGYKVFSRRYVKSFPRLSEGFEIETQLTIHALQMEMPVAEVETTYSNRVEGSESKLNTYRDGFRILRTILKIFLTEKPVLFFNLVASIIAVTMIALFMPIFMDYRQTGLVPRFPTLLGIVGLGVAMLISIVSGYLLEAISASRKETRRLHYLSIPLYQNTQTK
jgi:glycosyltransferase involved in cell wall biosynthesis